MPESVFAKLFRSWREFFFNSEQYQQRIVEGLSKSGLIGKLSCDDLLTLRRLNDASTWNVSSVLVHVVPHRMELRTQAGLSVVVWGFREKADRVISYISAPGCQLELVASGAGCVFRAGETEIASGGDILDERFELTVGERKMVVAAPRSRCEWNSAWQKPNHVVIEESGKEYCRLILQPFSGNARVVDCFDRDADPLTEPQLLTLLSLSVVLNARFVG